MKVQIKPHLHFLSDAEILPQKYANISGFDEFYETTVEKVQDSKFRQFLEDCKIFYNESSDTATKSSVLMLIEKVGEKYAKALMKAERAKAVSTQVTGGASHPDTDSILKAFFNADKGIAIK